jgi:hypothetical protein
MSEHPKREWRIEATRSLLGSGIWLNEEIFPAVTAIDLAVRPGMGTRLTLELVPHHVQVVTDPELTLIVGNHRFRVIEENTGDLNDGLFGERRATGNAHQSL